MATNYNVIRRFHISNYRLSGVARESLIIATSLALYTMVRVLVGGRADAAVANGHSVINLERSLGMFWELDIQSFFLSHAQMADVFRTLYVYGHLPVIGLVAVLLYYRAPSRYFLLRNAVLLSGAISLISYSLFPAAPPRLMPDAGFIDTVFAAGHESPLISKSLMNEYAAMPSLHFGWSVMVAVGLWWSFRNPAVRGFALVWPLIMGLTIVSTANHYLLDAVGGLIAVSLGMAIATVIGVPEARRRIVKAASQGRRSLVTAFQPDTRRPEPDRRTVPSYVRIRHF